MTTHDPMDALLDAFDEQPPPPPSSVTEASAEDAAVARIVAAVAREQRSVVAAPGEPGRAPVGRRWSRWLLVAAGLALMFALGRLSTGDRSGPTTAVLPAPPLVLAPEPPPVRKVVEPADTSDAMATEDATATVDATASGDTTATEDATATGDRVTPAPPERAEGLELLAGAVFRREGVTGVLDAGALRFVRNGERDPGVDRVRFGGSGLEAVPVGTVFVAATEPGVDGLAVTEGRVVLEDAHGVPLGEVRAGEALLAFTDGRRVTVERLDGRAVADIASRQFEVDPDLLARFVLSLRLAALPDDQRRALESFRPASEQGARP